MIVPLAAWHGHSGAHLGAEGSAEFHETVIIENGGGTIHEKGRSKASDCAKIDRWHGRRAPVWGLDLVLSPALQGECDRPRSGDVIEELREGIVGTNYVAGVFRFGFFVELSLQARKNDKLQITIVRLRLHKLVLENQSSLSSAQRE